MTTAALELNRVTKRFGTTEAVAGVSYAVGQGEMFGLIGPDGAGKTTTIRLLCGLLKPTSGSISVLGYDPVRQHHAITTKVGYFSQKFSLYGDLTIDENIAFFAEIHGVSHYRERRDRLLDMMQLTPFRARLAERLSGGMKQKLALACTLVHEPQIILLDEPTTGVDPVSRREFWRLLSEFLSQGITIFMATPYLDEAERCSRVALMSGGPHPGARRAERPARGVPGRPPRAAGRAAGDGRADRRRGRRRARRPGVRRAPAHPRAARQRGRRRGQALGRLQPGRRAHHERPGGPRFPRRRVHRPRRRDA